MAKVHTADIDTVIDRWFRDADPGDWCGVFENHDLGHPDLGRKLGLMFPIEQWSEVTIGKTCAPDTEIGLGWRYLLVAMCKTADEANAAFEDGVPA